MIVREFYTTRKDGVKLFRTYSDNNMRIRQVETGAEYSEAIDVEFVNYTYEETDTHIESIEESTIEDVEPIIVE
jgi:hypothetical protein